uniref:MV membrane protein n=1 Tax=Parastrongyloides trichosuri TaxID=131310 RepID=A0A0N5A0G7_PARTI
MNGLIVITSFILSIGVVLLIIGFDKTSINQGMDIENTTKLVMKIIGMCFTVIGGLTFIFSVYKQCIHEHQKIYKDDIIKKNMA